MPPELAAPSRAGPPSRGSPRDQQFEPSAARGAGELPIHGQSTENELGGRRDGQSTPRVEADSGTIGEAGIMPSHGKGSGSGTNEGTVGKEEQEDDKDPREGYD